MKYKPLTCYNCGCEIEHRSPSAMEDDFGYYCSEDCAYEYYAYRHGLDDLDWQNYEQECEAHEETSENCFGSYCITPEFVTNGRFAIYGNLHIPNEHLIFAGQPPLQANTNKAKWLSLYEASSDCELIDCDDYYSADGHHFQKKYIEFCCELIGTTPSTCRIICDTDLCAIKHEDNFAVIAPLQD